MAALRTYTKDPAAELDYEIDWSKEHAGDAITSSDWSAPPGLTIVEGKGGLTAGVAQVWLAGGTVGVRYPVTNRILTASGRTDERTLLIDVQQK